MHLVPALASTEFVEDPFAPRVGRRITPLRPADVPVPWYVVVDANLRRLEAGAAEVPLHLDTALALVLERELLRDRLSAEAAGHKTLAALDQVAAQQAGVRSPLPGADAVYLRSLTYGVDIGAGWGVVPRSGSEMCVSLPARLSARLLAAGWPEQVTIRDDLSAAIAFEIAGLCSGQTMSEWAAWTLREL